MGRTSWKREVNATMNRGIFLDRDGVINRALIQNGRPYSPSSLEDLEFLPGVGEAIRTLREAGFRIIVVTNQPDVGKGLQHREVVEAMHGRIWREFLIDDLKVCYHIDQDSCECRKPRPGMLLQAAEEWALDLSRSFMIGDRWRDIAAGRAAGCKTILVGDGYGELQAKTADAVVDSLHEASRLILSGDMQEANRRSIMAELGQLKIKIFADGADLNTISEMSRNPLIEGFTTNPTLMRKANVRDYRSFAQEVISIVSDRPVSFEVFSDDFEEMERQALEIASWAENVYVKIPVTNTRGESSGPLIRRLSSAGVQVNVTALLTLDQVAQVAKCMSGSSKSFISVFAGRIADTGRDPTPIMAQAVRLLRPQPSIELIWASPRELLNIFQADSVGCHIITATNDVLAKLPLVGKDLQDFSLETVQMFRQDAVKAGYYIEVSPGHLPLEAAATRRG